MRKLNEKALSGFKQIMDNMREKNLSILRNEIEQVNQALDDNDPIQCSISCIVCKILQKFVWTELSTFIFGVYNGGNIMVEVVVLN